jgi:hypothetical protein
MKIKRGDPCIFGDEKASVAHGWCSKHYYVWKTYGDPLYPVRSYNRQELICSTPDCGKDSHALGLCKVCYKRARNHGETTEPRERRFWVQVDRRGPDECWPWLGHLQKNGYGQYGTTGACLVHRIAYEYLIGPIPKRLVLDHLCHTRDPSCRAANECAHRRFGAHRFSYELANGPIPEGHDVHHKCFRMRPPGPS